MRWRIGQLENVMVNTWNNDQQTTFAGVPSANKENIKKLGHQNLKPTRHQLYLVYATEIKALHFAFLQGAPHQKLHFREAFPAFLHIQ